MPNLMLASAHQTREAALQQLLALADYSTQRLTQAKLNALSFDLSTLLISLVPRRQMRTPSSTHPQH